MCLAESTRKDIPGRETVPAKTGRGHSTQNKESRWSPLAVPTVQKERAGKEAG